MQPVIREMLLVELYHKTLPKNLNLLLPTAATNLFHSYLNVFKTTAVVSVLNVERDRLVKVFVLEQTSLRYGTTEHTECFELFPNGHYYIDFNSHAFQKFFYN